MQSSESHNTEMESVTGNKELLPRGSLGAAIVISVWEGHLPGTSNLGKPLHGASQGGKRINPKISLELELSLELPIWTAV